MILQNIIRLSALIAAFLGGVNRLSPVIVAPPLTPLPAVSQTAITPINWKRFKAVIPSKEDVRAQRILQNNARFTLAWIDKAFPYDAARKCYVVPPTGAQDGIRAPSSVAYGLAVLLQTGTYDASITGVPIAEARRRAASLIKGTAASYAPSATFAKGWGKQWQSALWTALLGQAGWMLWDDLDTETRTLVSMCVLSEADRFIEPGYRVPYWANREGKINFKGDSKAEENAWNAMVLQVAVALFPQHPRVGAWKRVGSELMVSSFAQQVDLEKETVLDGKQVKEWLNGFNIREDGGLINHNRLHPDYMATPIQNMRAYLVQSLAGQTVSQTADFNARLLYRTLAAHVWSSPPYEAPGGTMFQPGKAELYYPQKTDWSRYRFDIYYLMDAYADQFGWDKGLPTKARDWMRLRAERMQAMQARFPTGQLYAPGEFDTYSGREPLVAWQIGDAVLLHWLVAQNALQKPGNWFASSVR